MCFKIKHSGSSFSYVKIVISHMIRTYCIYKNKKKTGLRSRNVYDPIPRISRMPTPTPASRISSILTPTLQ